MHCCSRAFLAVALLVPLLAADAVADPWIESGVKPRLVGRGTTCEVVVAPWRHEATEVVFYPPATFVPWTAPDSSPDANPGIRCVGTHFDSAKQRLVCKLEVTADCR